MLNIHNLQLADLCSKEESRFTLNAILITKDCTVEIPASVPIDQRPAPATDDKTQRRKQAARKAWETIRAKRATAGKAA